MAYAKHIDTKAGKPADVRGDFAPAMNRVGDGGTEVIFGEAIVEQAVGG